MKLALPSLRLRLVAVMGLAYGVVAAATLATSYTVQQSNLQGQLESRARGDAAILAAGSVGFEAQKSQAALQTYVTSMVQRAPGVDYALVTDTTGKVIAASNGVVGHRFPLSFVTKPIARTSGGAVEGVAPIVQPGGTWLGLVLVRVSTTGTMRDLRNGLLLSALMQVLGLVLFLLLSLVIAQYILGPLVALSRTAGALRRGDLTARLAERSEAELSAVTGAFNTMAAALERRINHLSFLADAGSTLPSTLRDEGDIHPILQGFCEQINAVAAGLIQAGSAEPILWYDAREDEGRRELAVRAVDGVDGVAMRLVDGYAMMAVGVLGDTVFVTVRDASHPFEQEEQQVIINFAYQLGIAADNVRLFQAQQEALQVKDQFLSIVSHELRTPLTTIKGYAQMLQRMLIGNGDGERFAANIDAQAARLGRLVDDLLDVTRFARGQFELTRQEVRLDPVIEEVVARFRIVAPRHVITPDVGDAGLRGIWDRDRLEQVLNNLLSNAIKYSPEGSEVMVRTERRGAEVRVEVRDHGVGIPPEEQAQLFERFYRGSADASRIKGLGLGLYVTRRIIEAHGGAIGVRSDPGQGSVFYFTLPLQPAPTPARV